MLNRTRKGMTLLELIVVIVILGILALIAIPTFSAIIGKSKTQSAVTTGQALDKDAMGLAAFDQNPAGAVDGTSPATYVTVAAAADLSGVTVTQVAPGSVAAGAKTALTAAGDPQAFASTLAIGVPASDPAAYTVTLTNGTKACYAPSGNQGQSGWVVGVSC